MTKFSYSEYLSQFRNAGIKLDPALSKGERRGCTDRRRGSITSEFTEAVEPAIFAIRSGDVKALADLARSAPLCLLTEDKDGWIPLHEAAYCGQAECMKTLLTAHPGVVDKRTLQEQTALLLAVSFEHLSCVRCLLDAGADPDISSKNKETPLYKACEQENVELVSLILSYGANVNQRCVKGWTALHEAVSRDNTEICDMLVRGGASINPPNTYTIPPLTVATQHGRIKALRYLIEKGADVNMQMCDGGTALYEASKNGHKDIVAMLLAKNADANKPTYLGLLPLHVAAQNGHHEAVSLLVPVTSRARLRQSPLSPLHLAAAHNRRAAAAVLLHTGADVNAAAAPDHALQYADRRSTALYFAVASGSTETAELLMKAGAKLSLDPVSPLLMAVRKQCARTVSLLLEKGADVNVAIPAFPTTFPGAIALCMDNLPLLKCLLDSGCDALACFACTYGRCSHPALRRPYISTGSGYTIPYNDGIPLLACTETSATLIQFCEWLSTVPVSEVAGPILDLLLDYVGQVQPCARLTELLDSREDWLAVKRMSLSPRPLMHLCRLRICAQMGRDRLNFVRRLPLPDRLIKYLSHNYLML